MKILGYGVTFKEMQDQESIELSDGITVTFLSGSFHQRLEKAVRTGNGVRLTPEEAEQLAHELEAHQLQIRLKTMTAFDEPIVESGDLEL